MNCFSCRAELDAFLDATLSASQREKVAAHLQSCADCRAELTRLETDRETDRKLARAALGELEAVPAPPELRLRVRAALQDERAAQIARPSWWQRLGTPAKSRSAVWSGTLVFATLALIILARPFAQQPLSQQPLSIPDLASTESAPDEPASANAPLAAPIRAARAKRPSGAAPKKFGAAPQVAPGEARESEPKPNTNEARDSSRAKPPIRARELAPPVRVPPLPVPAPPVPLPAAPLPRRTSNTASSVMKMPPPSDSDMARIDTAQPSANRAKSVARPAESAASTGQNAAKPSPSLQNRTARVVTPNPASSNDSGAMVGQAKQSQAATNSVHDEAGRFEAKISLAESDMAGQDNRRNRVAVAGSRAAPGGKSASQGLASAQNQAAESAPPSALARQMPAPLTRGAAPTAPQAFAPEAMAPSVVAPQDLAPQAAAGGFGGGFGGRGGRDNTLDRNARGAAAPPNSPGFSAPKSLGAANETRQWTLEIVAPREVSGAQIRVLLPPSLRFAAGDESASRVVWSGDLAARRGVKIEFALWGAQGGEKISVVVEQNGVARQSKPLETLAVVLPIILPTP